MRSPDPKRPLAAAQRRYQWDTFRRHRSRWAISSLAMQIVPFIEVALIGLIYVLLDPNRQRYAGWAADHLPSGLAGLVSAERVAYTAAGLALLLLLTQLGLNYVAEMTLAHLRIAVYVEDSQALLARYFASTLETVRRIGRDRVTSSIINDCGVLGDNIKQWLEIGGAALALAVYMASSALISWPMLVVAAAVYALPLYLNRRVWRQLQNVGRMKVAAQELVLGFFNDILSGFQRVKLDALERPLQRRSTNILTASQDWRLAKRVAETRLRVAVDGLSLFGVIAVIFVGGTMLRISLASLLILFVMFGRMRAHVSTIMRAYSNLRSQRPNIERYLDLMAALQTSVMPDLSGAESRIGRVELDNVCFAYERSDAVLRGIELRLDPGDRVLITGPSGHGKSTLLEIIAGLLPPSAGRVLYGGEPLDEERFYRFRRRIAFVAPNVYLFNDTLRANLAIGIDPARLAARLDEAIARSGLSDVLRTLPQGLDTPLGPDGARLSLGQRQRVLLARLYLKQPDLVLLDEATANLDPALEADMIAQLHAFLPRDAIAVMIAHKPPRNYAYTRHYRLEDGSLSLVESRNEAVA
jgi:ABC-type bacteriocin/lantibiotic exporter with double-glycine peptidase domain